MGPGRMKIKLVFNHHKKSKDYSFSPYLFFFGEDSSTGPVLKKGDSFIWEIEIKNGDTVEYSTTKFTDEIEVKIYRNGKLLNIAK